MAAASVVLVAARGTLPQQLGVPVEVPELSGTPGQETCSPGAFGPAALHGAALLQQPGRFYPGRA